MAARPPPRSRTNLATRSSSVASEFAFAPPEIVAEPGTYTGVLVNDGTIEHDITFGDGEPIVAAPGESVEFEFTVPEEGIALHLHDRRPRRRRHDRHGPHPVVGGGSRGGRSRRSGGAATHGGAAEVAIEPDESAPAYELRDPPLPQRGEGEGVTLVAGGAPGGGDLIEVELRSRRS